MKIAKVIARAGMIAALYTGLTYAFAFSSFATWTVQFRISEVLTILPLFWGEAVVGLWVGCLLGNLISAPLDIAFGSSATLIASLLTFLIAGCCAAAICASYWARYRPWSSTRSSCR